jgi:hypothetical protein
VGKERCERWSGGGWWAMMVVMNNKNLVRLQEGREGGRRRLSMCKRRGMELGKTWDAVVVSVLY